MSSILEVRNVTKKFGGLVAVNDVSFDVNKEEILSVIGPNGAGKSTLFKLISSFLKTTSGEIYFKGERISNLRPHIVAQKGVVRTFQETTIFKNMTVRETIIVAQHLRSKATLGGYFWGTKIAQEDNKAFGIQADELLDFIGLDNLRNEVASNLTQGNLRALGMAIGLATDPEILLLDEPFAGMNPEETKGMVDLVRSVRNEKKVTVLLVEHDMSAVMSISERIVVLNFGSLIAEGTAQEIQNNEMVIEAYLGRADDALGT